MIILVALCFRWIENTKDFNTKEELKRKYEGRNHKRISICECDK